MMRLPEFKYVGAQTLADAAAVLADDPAGTRVVAGGTDLWPNMKRRHEGVRTVVGLRRVPGLQEILVEGDGNGSGEVRVGAMTTLSEITRSEALRASHPGFVKAVASISSPVLRNMGTIGGNLCLDTRCNYYNQSEEWRRSVDYCMKEDGEVCWVAPSSRRCWAVWAGDLAPVLTVLDAEVRLVSKEGERTVPVAGLYRDDGIDYLKKRPEEILSEIVLPARSCSDRCRSSFQKLRRRGAIDFPVLSVAASLFYDGNGSIERCSVVLGSVASLPLSVGAVPELLVGRKLDEEAIREASRLCRRAATPLDNTDYMAQWRGKMVEVFAERALRACQ